MKFHILIALAIFVSIFHLNQEDALSQTRQQFFEDYSSPCSKIFIFDLKQIKPTYIDFSPYWCGDFGKATFCTNGFNVRIHNGTDYSINKMTYKVTLKNPRGKVLFSKTYTYNQNFHVHTDLDLKIVFDKKIKDDFSFNGVNHPLFFEVLKIEDYQSETAHYISWYIKEKMENCSSAHIVEVFNILKQIDPQGTSQGYKSIVEFCKAKEKEYESDKKWDSFDVSFQKLWKTLLQSADKNFQMENLVEKTNFPVFTGNAHEAISKKDFEENYDYFHAPFKLFKSLTVNDIKTSTLSDGTEYYYVKLDCTSDPEPNVKDLSSLELRFQKISGNYKLTSLIPGTKYKGLSELNSKNESLKKMSFYRMTFMKNGSLLGHSDILLLDSNNVILLYKKLFDSHVQNKDYNGQTLFQSMPNRKVLFGCLNNDQTLPESEIYTQWGGSKLIAKRIKNYIYANAVSEFVTDDKFYIALDDKVVGDKDFLIGGVISGLDVIQKVSTELTNQIQVTIAELDEKTKNEYLQIINNNRQKNEIAQKAPRQYTISISEDTRESHVNGALKYGNIEIEIFGEDKVSKEYRQDFEEGVVGKYYDYTYIGKIFPNQFITLGIGRILSSIKMNPVKPHPAKRGDVYAMPNGSDVNDAIQSFIIVLKDNAVFHNTPIGEKFHLVGRVISGIELADKISNVKTSSLIASKNLPEENLIIFMKKKP